MLSKLFRWFIANTLLPIFTPVFFMCMVGWFQDGTFLFGVIFIELVQNGFYIFSALALIFSLIEDFPVFKLAGIGFGYGVWLMVLIIMTLSMFYQIQTKDSGYIQSHVLQFVIVWCFSAISAIAAKYRIIKYKTNNNV